MSQHDLMTKEQVFMLSPIKTSFLIVFIFTFSSELLTLLVYFCHLATRHATNTAKYKLQIPKELFFFFFHFLIRSHIRDSREGLLFYFISYRYPQVEA